jgi:hypothetical protein
MSASLVEALVEDDDWLEVGMSVDFPAAVLSRFNTTQVVLNRDKHCYIVIVTARLAALRSAATRSRTF